MNTDYNVEFEIMQENHSIFSRKDLMKACDFTSKPNIGYLKEHLDETYNKLDNSSVRDHYNLWLDQEVLDFFERFCNQLQECKTPLTRMSRVETTKNGVKFKLSIQQIGN